MKAVLAMLLGFALACHAPRASPADPAVASQPAAAALVAPRAWSHAPAADARPAGMPMPKPPDATRGAALLAREQSGELVRNGVVQGRLPEAGLRASFPFVAAAGEQSLFEFAGFGYERGAAGRVRLSIEDASGHPVWQSERDVAVVWRDFSAFTAPNAGAWTYRIDVLQGGYRFVLVRHSDYAPLGDLPIEFGPRERVHGHLPDPRSTARFLIPVEAGEELALKLTATREEAQAEARRGALSMEAMAATMQAMPAQGAAEAMATDRGAPAAEPMAGGRAALYQHFVFEVLQGGEALGPVGTYLRLKAPRAGSIEVRVQARNAVGGGLFDLALERSLHLVPVHGVVQDSEDRPLPGVELLFLREPDGDLLATGRSDEQGRYQLTVMPGRLAIQMRRGESAAREAVRVQVDADMQLDLVFLPGARRRSR